MPQCLWHRLKLKVREDEESFAIFGTLFICHFQYTSRIIVFNYLQVYLRETTHNFCTECTDIVIYLFFLER